MTKTSAVYDLYAQEASHNENDKIVMLKTGSTTETPAVHDLYT